MIRAFGAHGQKPTFFGQPLDLPQCRPTPFAQSKSEHFSNMERHDA
jgi:hypothetical protein